MRESLGMTLDKLGSACGVSSAAIAQLEKREPTGRITVESLRKVAKAMNCEIVYSFVPQTNQKEFVDRRAYEKAKRISKQKIKGDIRSATRKRI